MSSPQSSAGFGSSRWNLRVEPATASISPWRKSYIVISKMDGDRNMFRIQVKFAGELVSSSG